MRTYEGTVSAFDDARGLGIVTSDSGSRWPFHCVSLADGTRTVSSGARVRFSISFRVLRLEAVEIEKI